MSSIGSIILDCGRGFLHVARPNKTIPQLSVENFSSHKEATQFCRANGLKREFSTARNSLSRLDRELLRVLSYGPMQAKQAAENARMTTAELRFCVERLAGFGLISARDGAAGEAIISLSDAGAAVARAVTDGG